MTRTVVPVRDEIPFPPFVLHPPVPICFAEIPDKPEKAPEKPWYVFPGF